MNADFLESFVGAEMPPRACPLVTTTTTATEAAIEGANRAPGSINEQNEPAVSAPATRKPKPKQRH